MQWFKYRSNTENNIKKTLFNLQIKDYILFNPRAV